MAKVGEEIAEGLFSRIASRLFPKHIKSDLRPVHAVYIHWIGVGDSHFHSFKVVK